MLSPSQALWAGARAAGVAVTALCPGPTRTGFVDALGAEVGHTAIYRRLADPEPVIEAGLRALDKERHAIPGVRNKIIAASGRFMPREWLALVSARLLRPAHTASRPPIEVHNEIVIQGPGRTCVGSVDRRRTVAVVVSGLPVGPSRADWWCGIDEQRRPTGVLPVEGTPGRSTQRGGGQRTATFVCHRRGRPGVACRALVHPSPHARRPEHGRRQP